VIPDPRFGTENGADVRSGREALEIAFLVQNTSSSVSSSPSVPPTLSNFSHLPPALAAAVGGPQPFSSFGLATPILNVLKEQGYHTPTPIQAETIPLILGGRDVLGCAQTGTGKTAAFALPIIHSLMSSTVDKTRKGPVLPRVLVLSPTRELATQIADSFVTYGAYSGLSVGCVFGGVSQFHQVRALHRGVDVLIATPGRLMDLMEQGHVILSNIKVFVLDEADRMLDMGFINPIRMIASKVPQGRQTLLFSATMPREIMHLADSLLTKPAKVSVTPVASAAPLIEQRLYHVPRNSKTTLLRELLNDVTVTRALVFTKTKHGADKLTKKLNLGGIKADVIHGNKAQNYRTRALELFRSGKSRVLVATDVAARGLDVDGISLVVNFDLPMEPEAYVHRIGRTGRAGNTGVAVSFCDSEERGLLRDIERLTAKRIPVIAMPQFSPEAIAADAKAQRDPEERDYRDARTGRRESRSEGQRPGQGRPRDGGSFGGSGSGSGGGSGRRAATLPPSQGLPHEHAAPARGPSELRLPPNREIVRAERPHHPARADKPSTGPKQYSSQGTGQGGRPAAKAARPMHGPGPKSGGTGVRSTSGGPRGSSGPAGDRGPNKSWNARTTKTRRA